MSDAKDDLKAALAARQDRDAERDREKDEMARARAAYEQEERAVMAQLNEAADLMVQALARTVQTESIPITPRPTGLGHLVRSQQHVDGWKISLGVGEGYVLCPDGKLISPQLFHTGSGPRYSSLREWLDQQRRSVHAGSAESGTTPWGEAFSPTSRPYRDRATAQTAMRTHLANLKDSTTKKFAEVLHEHGASL